VRDRHVWLFATLGWDPTWQKRVPRRIRVAWTVALALIVLALGALAVIGAWSAPPVWAFTALGLMVLGVAGLSAIQYLVRREIMSRLDVEQDHQAAQQIQARLLPSSLPALTGVELAGHYSPYRLIGGDFYDAMLIGESRLLIAMADVSGKGAAAALLTANLQALLHFSQLREQPPDVVVRTMNEHLVRYTETNRFVTMVLAVYDLDERRLTYVNAGHNPPVAVVPSGEVVRLEATGPAMGWFDTAPYVCAEVALPPGSTVLFYTDGLSERANRAGEQYGIPRIVDLMRTLRNQPATGVAEAVVAHNNRFAAGAAAEDDTALLVLRTL
jgi:sigma-B regulation protein RsbU (phosphoserine phosphatase)